MYADRKHWPLEAVYVALTHGKVHSDDCAACETEVRMLDRVELEIGFIGALSVEQRKRLLEIAGKCPVHRTLTSKVEIHTRVGGPLPSWPPPSDELAAKPSDR